MSSGRVISRDEAEQVLEDRSTGFAEILMALRTQHGIMRNQIDQLGDGFIDRLPFGHHAGVEHSFLLYKAELRAVEAGIELITALLPHENVVKALADASRGIAASNAVEAAHGAAS